MASVRDLNIRELTELAKKRGLKGYSNKNKSEFLRLLEAQENLLDQPVPDINVPVLWRMLSASLVIFRKTQKKHGQSHVIPY